MKQENPVNSRSEESASSRAQRLLRGAGAPATQKNRDASVSPRENKISDEGNQEAAGEALFSDEVRHQASSLSSSGRASQKPSRPEPVSAPELGEVLWLDDGSVAIYREPVPGKDCDFIYELSPGGKIRARGIKIQHYRPRTLGKLDDTIFREMIHEKKWQRDAILYHLNHWSFGRFLPSSNGERLSAELWSQGRKEPSDKPSDASSEPKAAEGAEDKSGDGKNGDTKQDDSGRPSRGARVSIKSPGGNSWEAIYWNSGAKGDVLAHQVNGKWELTTVDLRRFGENVKVGEGLSKEEVRAINEALMEES